MMKKLFSLFIASFVALSVVGQISKAGFERWHADKYSMFIHFGLYSELGGVWNGEPVRQGYSEQIQSFAGIFSDWYGETAQRFRPTAFDADALVALAKEAGMRSIVFTTKHHDGFCMFGTKTTGFNSVEATPDRRDLVKELAGACQRGGIRFGMYFSIIDWHSPYGAPISSHNADFVTPELHELNKAQVRELLTNYGPVSELWFDMGSNTPEQSRELYELVHQLQPDCMVSGRLGNDFYDFSVMADNRYPEGVLQCPWQSAASMFNETWSYRSWQERGSVKTKAEEKLRSLINVVAHGGNFLLNIGPKGDGSVVPFEREVLMSIGAWLKKNGDAIYGTEASPFRERFGWGAVTRKGNNLYLILSGEHPKEGSITLPVDDALLLSADVPTTREKSGRVTFRLPADAYDGEIKVIAATFDRPIEPQPLAEGRTPNYSYSCFDYYSNYRSTVSYQWNFVRPSLKGVELTYTPQEVGQELLLEVDGKEYTVVLNAGKEQALKPARLTWGKRYLCGPAGGLFDGPETLEVSLEKAPRGKTWQEVAEEQAMFPANIHECYYLMQEVESPRAQELLMEVGAGNGIELFLNGRSLMKHLNPYRCPFREEQVLLPLQKGKNQLVLRLYNRFERQTGYLLRPANEQVVYKQRFNLPETVKGKRHTVVVKKKSQPSIHRDAELANLELRAY